MIQEIQIGDVVLSHTNEQSIVTRKIVHNTGLVYKLTFSDGSTLRATKNHTVLSFKGWVTLGQVTKGDGLCCGSLVKVIASIDTEPQIEQVYNLCTTGQHTFVSEGFSVHNFTTLRNLRTLMHQIFVDPLFITTQRTQKWLRYNS